MASEKKFDAGNVLVVGGNGFVGHHMVAQILERWNAKVTVIDLRCTRNRRPDSDGVNYIEADITDEPAILSIFEDVKPDLVIHTASPAAQGSDAVAKDMFRKVNVDGTRVIVKACQDTGVRALVYTSSASVLSDNQSDLINADERWPVIRGDAQTEYYTETKVQAEEIVLQANRAEGHKLLTVSIRPSGIFGEGDNQTMPGLLKLIDEGKTNIQVGSNENLFDFTYVGNVVHAHLLAGRLLLATSNMSTQPLDSEKVDGEAFLITNDQPIYFWDFGRSVWAAAGVHVDPARVWRIPREVGLPLAFVVEVVNHVLGRRETLSRQRLTYSCMTRYYNINKAKRLLGYRPIWPLPDAIKRSVQWFQNEKLEKPLVAAH